ncbi:diguanylate cyclase [Massilia sp. NEAU-DD11]|uniref:diguanylate cyclase n=1 Tax=Massilia cellulosiltytica TaxID=2683234 RepID=A0A7X3K9M4_9BURK|nr:MULTISPECIES: GGDEF domain-containing protein [unclassified Massilia]MVW62495.1 diguanylate cyclase [Telluria cellulosilytica]
MSPQDPHRPNLAIDCRRAEFADPASESRFTRQFLPERNRQLKASLLFAAAFYVAFAATDFATLGDTAIAWMLMGLRSVVALVGLGCFAAIVRHPRSVRVSIRAACTLLVAALAVFMVVCWFQPQVLAWNAMSQALILMAVYVNFPNRFIYAVAIGVGSSIVFAAMLAIQGNLRADDLLTLVLLLVMGNALGYIAARRFHVAQREQFRASLQLQQLADRDPLTGCHNRRFLQKGLLNAELERTRRYGAPLSVVLCDLDHFKRINDTYGHAAGDQVLADFAGLLLSLTRDTVDSVIRYGGEEFLLVLPQTDLAGAQALAERIRAAFADAPGATIKATASFGIASVPAQAPVLPASSEALIGAADAQLYAAKRGGRNMVCATLAGP